MVFSFLRFRLSVTAAKNYAETSLFSSISAKSLFEERLGAEQTRLIKEFLKAAQKKDETLEKQKLE